MKLFNHFVRYAVLSVVPVVMSVACTGEKNPVNNVPVSGNIVGKIQTVDGTPARGATVRLAPVNFDPHAHYAAAGIDSTTTDDNGTFAFTLRSSGFFNVSAQSREGFSFEDSVYGSDKGQIDIETRILKSPGSISGTARLNSGNDNTKIIILLLGTHIYTMPTDSTGAFSTPALAEGTYWLRFLTTEKGYGVRDTSVNVASGRATVIPEVVKLPFEEVPAIGPVTAVYDMPMMRVNLSWAAVDTKNVEKIYVFRNTGVAGQPVAELGRSDTSFTDDLMLLEPGTLSYGAPLKYCVAACNKNNVIGPSAATPDTVLKGILMPLDTLPAEGLVRWNDQSFAVDKHHNVYFCEEGWIKKFDSTGRESGDYCDGFCAGGVNAEECHSRIAADRSGNIYYYFWRESKLISFSADLTLRSSRVLTRGLQAMDTDTTGRLYLLNLADSAGGDASIYVLDSLLTITDSIAVEFVGGGSFNLLDVQNGEIVYRGDPQSAGNTGDGIRFNCVSLLSFDALHQSTFPFPKDEAWLKQFDYLADGGRIVAVTGLQETSGNWIHFIDPDGDLFAKSRIEGGYYVFDGADRIYLSDYGDQSIHIYQIKR